QPQRRKSPKRGRLEAVFSKLVSFPRLLLEDNFSLEVVLIHEEDVRRFASKKRRRNAGWVTVERRLLEVVAQYVYEQPSDLSALLPAELPDEFTTLDLAKALNAPRRLAQKMVYCLREIDEIVQVGKRGRAVLYSRANAAEVG
ncbi:MAG: hypothetical protein HN413_16180, partial [Chloroflexi bacterium]|nr:hypothetical protein [Chloroflexota bacterium]